MIQCHANPLLLVLIRCVGPPDVSRPTLGDKPTGDRRAEGLEVRDHVGGDEAKAGKSRGLAELLRQGNVGVNPVEPRLHRGGEVGTSSALRGPSGRTRGVLLLIREEGESGEVDVGGVGDIFGIDAERPVERRPKIPAAVKGSWDAPRGMWTVDLGARVGVVTEESVVTDGQEMMGVDRFDKAAKLVHPVGNGRGLAGPRGSSAIGSGASRVVDELPSKDGGLVLKCRDNELDESLRRR